MKVFVSLGERSASNYIYEIFKDVKGINFTAITDERLESIGFESIAKIEDLSVVGITEAIPKIPYVYSLWKRIEKLLPDMDAIILCDAPAFNLPLLKRAKGKVKKVIYFISPQVWAWKEDRAKLISELVDHLVVLLPFEVEFYEKYKREGFHVHFVGHPLVDLAKASLSERQVREILGVESYMAVLPGSRWSEIKRHVPYLRQVFRCLEPRMPIFIPTFESFKDYIREGLKDFPVRTITPKDMEKPAYNLMAYADFTLVASGTAELEASLLFSPHLVFYRVSPISYLLGKLLVKVKHVSLTNLILNKEAVPELVQKKPQQLCGALKEFLEDVKAKEQMLGEFKRLRDMLGGEGTILKLRELFLQLLHHS
ncbi:MAG: lipid-A-disaccharide synthase [Aquificaceae bacterium]|nr:lipid-A-disaccharide synthase [Aquificaceae bacterium]